MSVEAVRWCKRIIWQPQAKRSRQRFRNAAPRDPCLTSNGIKLLWKEVIRGTVAEHRRSSHSRMRDSFSELSKKSEPGNGSEAHRPPERCEPPGGRTTKGRGGTTGSIVTGDGIRARRSKTRIRGVANPRIPERLVEALSKSKNILAGTGGRTTKRDAFIQNGVGDGAQRQTGYDRQVRNLFRATRAIPEKLLALTRVVVFWKILPVPPRLATLESFCSKRFNLKSDTGTWSRQTCILWWLPRCRRPLLRKHGWRAKPKKKVSHEKTPIESKNV